MTKTWITQEKLDANKLNVNLADEMQSVYDGNRDFVEVRNGVSDLSVAAVTWQPVDPTVFWAKITTAGDDIKVTAAVNIRNSLGGQGVRLDVYVVNLGIFLSSLTDTPLTHGLWKEHFGSNYTRKRAFTFLWAGVPIGSYHFQLWWQTTGSGNAMLNLTNTINHFIVREWGNG